MANTSSAKKAARQATKRRAHNMTQRTALRTAVKNVRKAIAAGDKAAAQAAFKKVTPELMRGATKGVLAKGTVSRKLSRLSARIKSIAA